MKNENRSSEMAVYDAAYRMGGMGDAPWGAAGTAPGQPVEQSFMALVDDRMRGRWRWAILLGVFLGLTLAALGYLSTEPMYRSIGAVRVAPQVPFALTEMPEHFIRDYERTRATQVRIMREQSLLRTALTHKELAKLPFAADPSALKQIKRSLEVEADRDSHLIYVMYDSPDPQISQAVVNAVLWAYYESHGKQGGINLSEKIRDINDVRQQAQMRLNNIDADRKKIIDRYHMNDLGELERDNYEQIRSLEARIQAGKQLVARMEQRDGGDGSSGPPVRLPTSKELEEAFPRLVALRQQRDSAAMDFEMAKKRFLPTFRQYKIAEQRALDANAIFEDEMAKAIEEWQRLGPTLLAEGRAFEGMSVEETKHEVARLETQLASLQQFQQQLSTDVQAMQQLNYQHDQNMKEWERANERSKAFEVESKYLKSLINIEAHGFLPDEPNSDGRKKRAIFGAALGLLGSFGVFFLLGTLDRRAYGARQLSAFPGSMAPTCLGVLPDLGRSLNDPETSDVASHCVHHIRNQIEALRDPENGYVLAITSPFQGDGKTSIVMALGWSYAAAGFNTLLVDCDLVGRSLTRQLGMTGREGLKEALISRELNGAVSKMPVENLSAIPVGIDARFGPETVRRSDLQRVLEDARKLYDIIIVDTGPMLGSLESTPVTASADGVLLSVRRGRSRTKLDECVGRLKMVGTKCVGVVLNCATRSDCNRYVSEASLAAAEEDRIGHPTGESRNGAAAHNGNSHAIVQVGPGQRNALIRAMQSAAKFRETQV